MRRDEVQRRFGAVLTSVAAHSAARDRDGGALPRTVLREAGALGMLGLGLPEEVGGAGLDGQRWGRALEEIGYLCDDMSFSLLVSLMPAVAMAIHETGRRDLTERYVVPMARGERLAAFAWTEDADAFSLSSTVREREGGFVANGRKLYVSGGMLADTFMTYVRDQQDDVRVFLIERDDPASVLRLRHRPGADPGVRGPRQARVRPPIRLVDRGSEAPWSRGGAFLNDARRHPC